MAKRKNRAVKMLTVGLALLLAFTLISPLHAFASKDGETGEASSEDAPQAQHRVVFYDAEGEVFTEMLLDEGALVPHPADAPPAPQGQVFSGWFENGALFDFAFATLQEELYLTPGFEAEKTTAPADAAAAQPAPPSPASATPPAAAPAADEAQEHTVTFMAGENVYHRETVLHNTLVPMPQPPADESGLPFVAWYSAGSVFSPTTLVTGDLVLNAKFDSDTFIVQVLDVDGSVLQAYEATSGQPVPEPAVQPTLKLGEAFLHWYAGNENEAFVFENPAAGNITLRPALSPRAVAVFVTGGGTEVEPQVGETGFTAANPGPIARSGYKFVRWAAQPDGGTDFPFDAKITGTTYIYAVWEAQKVGYIINYYNENPNAADADPQNNPGDYELVYTRVLDAAEGGKAGQTPDITADFANIKYVSGGQSVQNILNHSSLVYVDAKPLSGSGNTVINVYYDRTVYTFQLNVKSNEWLSLRSGETINGPATHVVRAKLGQDIRQTWPVDFGGSNGNKKAINWSGYYGRAASTLSLGYIEKGFGAGRPSETSTNLDIRWNTAGYAETRHYYLETLNGEATENAVLYAPQGKPQSYYEYAPEHDGVRNYQSTNPVSGAVNWPGRDIAGFETITAGTHGLAPYYHQVAAADEQPEKDNGVKDYIIRYYMPRKSYALTLVSGDGTLEDPGHFIPTAGGAEMELQYGAKIELPQDPQKDNYAFAGWYYDPLYQNPYQPGDTMPAGATTLHAKFRGTDVAVNYWDGGAAPAYSTSYARGEALDEHELQDTPYAGLEKGDSLPGRGIFQGWYYEPVPSVSVEFPTEMPLTSATYNLTARFDEETYSVTFVDVDGNGNYDANSPLAVREVRSGAKNTLAKSGYTELVPTRLYYTFRGWYTNSGAGYRLTTATPVLADTTVYAVWERQQVTLAYDPNGGALQDGVQGSVQLGRGASLDESGIPLLENAAVAYEGHVFLGWFTAPQGGAPFTASTVLQGDTTVYARWQKTETPVTVTFDGNGGQTDPALLQMQMQAGGSLHETGRSTPDERVAREGHTFLGWFSRAEDGLLYTPQTLVTDDITVYAHWQADEDGDAGVPFTTTETPGMPQPPAPGGIAPLGAAPAPLDAPAFEAAAAEAAALPETLGGQDTPLGGIGEKGGWSLLSLIMGIAGLLIALPLLVTAILPRRKKGEDDGENDTQNAQKHRSRLLKLLAMAPGLLAGLLFLLLNNLLLPVVFVNSSTPVIAIVFLVHLALVAVQYFVRRKNREDENGGETPATA